MQGFVGRPISTSGCFCAFKVDYSEVPRTLIGPYTLSLLVEDSGQKNNRHLLKSQTFHGSKTIIQYMLVNLWLAIPSDLSAVPLSSRTGRFCGRQRIYPSLSSLSKAKVL